MIPITQNVFNRRHAKFTGCLFIVAAVTSIIGLKLYDPILNDNRVVLSASDHYNQVVLGAINELILVVTAAGTGIMLFPLLNRYSLSMALGYLSFRLLEVVLIVIGIVSMLTVLTISQHYANGLITNNHHAHAIMLAFIGVHKWTFMIGPNFMLAINTFIYSYVFMGSGFLPKNLARLGLLSSFLIMVAAILEMFDIIYQISTWGILLAVPIAIYEMTLAFWLIFKVDK
jgi:hypothetical protein